MHLLAPSRTEHTSKRHKHELSMLIVCIPWMADLWMPTLPFLKQREPLEDVNKLVERLKTQKGIVIDSEVIDGANHFFEGKLEELMDVTINYLDERLVADGKV